LVFDFQPAYPAEGSNLAGFVDKMHGVGLGNVGRWEINEEEELLWFQKGR
jgi:hypothetical protein